MKKEYTIEDFKPTMYSKPITTSGYSYHTNINYSSILTLLIQEAGRWCKRFASDLFVDWQSVIRAIDDPEEEMPPENEEGWSEKHWLFGFREDGVDHAAYVLHEYTDNPYGCHHYYRALYKLTVRKTGDRFEMALQELQR